MVNNNGIPIEVKKPFETVYKIKNEIPSFEEFMKTYENDGKLNYDDLNTYNIIIDKGYGPCSGYWNCNDSRCYGSNACLYNERFFDLKTPCPAADCPKKQQGPTTNWYHNNPGCGSSKDKISDECRIRCPDCFNTTHMKYHKFKCSAHPKHEVQYRETTSVSFSFAITMAINSGLSEDVYSKIMIGIKREHERSGW